MDPKSQRSSALCAHHAQMAVRDWLETQARVTGYWRDVLLSSGGSEELIAVLDHHADVLAEAARLDSAEPVFAHQRSFVAIEVDEMALALGITPPASPYASMGFDSGQYLPSWTRGWK